MDKKKIGKEILSWVFVFVSAFVIVTCLNSAVFATATVKQSSMEDTLLAEQKLFINKFNYNFSTPKIGDIVIFLELEEKGGFIDEAVRYLDSLVLFFTNHAEDIDTKYPRLVKRVVGAEGDRIDIKDGHVYINEEELTEPYAKGITLEGDINLPITVGKNQLFVLGDNRSVSEDSRDFGLIHINQVEGKAVFRFAPFNKIGKVK